MVLGTATWVSRDPGNNGTLPKFARLAQGGLLSKSSASALNVRTGVLFDGGPDVVTGVPGAMAYSLRACHMVLLPSAGQGPLILVNDAALQVTTDPAPGTNSRIDTVWVRQHLTSADGGPDTNVIGELGVLRGAVSPTPTPPNLALAVPGAMALKNALVTAGAPATDGLTFSTPHNWTVANGAAIPVRSQAERDAISAYESMQVYRLDTDSFEYFDGTAWNAPTSTTPWTFLTLTNSWVPYGSGYFTPAYRKVGDTVQLRGTMKSGSASAVLGTVLPLGFRPTASASFILPAYPGAIRLDVTSGGQLNLINPYIASGANSAVALDGVTFCAP